VTRSTIQGALCGFVFRRAGFSASRVVRATILAIAVLLAVSPQVANGSAILTPPGHNAHSVPRGDDTSNLVVNLPFAMNWNGTNHTQIYINMNGNCTFGSGFTTWNPSTTLAATNRNIMAPLWADVDTRNTAAAQVTYSSTTAGSVPQVNGRNAFFVNWVGVARYNNQSTPTNSFQLVLIDRSDTGPGNFDFMFNYNQVAWDIATSESTVRARAGWGFSGTGFELPGSGVPSSGTSALLDTSASSTSLIQNSLNSGGQLGRYVFEVRNGTRPNIPPQVTVADRVLEGTVRGGFASYDVSGDVTAVDPDGSIASLTHNAPGLLPIGVTNVTWSAVDDRGAVTTAVQRITVRDTAPPVNPALTSPTHSTGVWTSVNVATVNSAGATDVCSGVRGFSYVWSQGAPETPDTLLDPAVETPGTVEIPVTVNSQTFPGATWPLDWIRSNTTYARVTNQAGRTQGSFAAEVWADSGQRRTIDFYRDYNLTGLTRATLTFWDRLVGSNSSDYVRAEVSTNGGASYTQLSNATTNAAWQRRTFDLPAGGTVRIRFSASVNSASEHANWDDIVVTGAVTAATSTFSTSATRSLADGTWHFGLRTVDHAGNWSAPVHLGPLLIDTTHPQTTSNAPAGWSAVPVTVALTVTDAGQVAYTRYSLAGGPWTNYTGPVLVSAEGVSELRFHSADAAGHVEPVRSVLVRVDTIAPSVPDPVTATVMTTSSAEVAWPAAFDSGSGVSGYRVYRDGALVSTTSALRFTDTSLIAGGTYTYQVAAVDAADNESALSTSVTVTVPISGFWLTVSENDVQLGPLEPEQVVSRDSATTVTVGGVGGLSYDLSCQATDFVALHPGSSTPAMSVGVLSFAIRGWTSRSLAPFSSTSVLIGSSTGTPHVWSHPYIFDLQMTVPYDYEPGEYRSTLTFTAVLR